MAEFIPWNSQPLDEWAKKYAKGSLGNKFTNSKVMISMSCWFVTNALVLYPIEIKLEKMIVFSN